MDRFIHHLINSFHSVTDTCATVLAGARDMVRQRSRQVLEMG